MGNRVYVKAACFVPMTPDRPLELDPKELRYGYVVYDDAEEAFVDHFGTPEEVFPWIEPDQIITTLEENGHQVFAGLIQEYGGYMHGNKGWLELPEFEEEA